MKLLVFFLFLSLFASPKLMAEETPPNEKRFIEALESEMDGQQKQKIQRKRILKKKAELPMESESLGIDEPLEGKGPEVHPKIKEYSFLLGDRHYGQFRIRLAGMRPDFNSDVKFYSELYGNENWYPNLMVDWIPWDWVIGLGFSFRVGYYADKGFALRSASVAGQALDIDKNQKTRLRIYPLQLVAVAQMTPFSQKWVGLDIWAGYEHLFFSETRLSSSDEVSANDLYTNTGSGKNFVFGGAVNLLLNPLDEHGMAMIRNGLGIGYVYLSYIFEVSQEITDGDIDFSRMTQGFAFTFETAL